MFSLAHRRSALGYHKRLGDIDSAIATQVAILDGCKLVHSLCRSGTDDESALPFWVVGIVKGEFRFGDSTLQSCAMVQASAAQL